MQRQDVYVVPHSHWDAEWYFTCEDSHILLVENLDALIALLEKDDAFPAYTFDGLACVLEEYLRVRPENRQRLAALIAGRRLFVGPWYTQCDSLLIRTESLIRNLQCGMAVAEAFGHSMNIGYLPDIFGQHAWLPSLFTQLGIDYAVLQRGIYTDELEGDLNLWWQSPDGAKIATNYLYYGYGPGKFLSDDEAYLQHRLLPILTALKKMNRSTRNLLLPAGGDQVLANPRFPQIVAALNQKALPWRFILADYERYMRETWSEASFHHTLKGELYACQKSRIHRTCHSTRYDIKRQNWQTEHLLIDKLEPLAALASIMGIHWPSPVLASLWKTLFMAQAHNGVEATNADPVNQNIKNRLISVERSALSLINLLKKKISYRIAQPDALVVFNGDPHPGTRAVEAVVFTRRRGFALYHQQQKVPCTILRQEKFRGGQRIVVTAEGEKREDLEDYYRSEILFNADLPGLGWQTYRVEEGPASPRLTPASCTNVENAFFRVMLHDGALTFENRQTGVRISDPFTFVDCGDDGDAFDFAPLADDVELRTAHFTLIRCEVSDRVSIMTLETPLRLPADMLSRQAGRRDRLLTIETTLTLRQDEPLLRVQHRLTNKAKDHRLRVHLATPVHRPSQSYADQGFSVIARETQSPWLKGWREKGFVEKPMPIYTLENGVYLRDESHSFGALTQGIKEYEVLPASDTLALTLFRSVGLLGKDDTPWRPGRASGINNCVVETPDAQMLQPMLFDYALALDTLADEQALFSAIQGYRPSWMTYQVQDLNTFEERLERFAIPLPEQEMPAACSLVSLDNPRVFMSLCKPGVRNDELIVRLFNPGTQPEAFSLTTLRPCLIQYLDLKEAVTKPATAPLLIPAGHYQTFSLLFS